MLYIDVQVVPFKAATLTSAGIVSFGDVDVKRNTSLILVFTYYEELTEQLYSRC
jgi:hypothetical protein